MGIFNAITNSIGQSSDNMFKGFYMSDSLSSETLMQRGFRHTSSRDSVKGDPNIITNGSIISVSDGQAAIVVCSGRVTSIFTEPGEHKLTKEGNVSLFEKGGVGKTVGSAINRIGFGGDYASSQRLYYVNTKEIIGNRFSTEYPIPVTIHDIPGNNCMDVYVSIKGTYCMRITRPDILYKKVTGNVLLDYTVSQLSSQINSELMSAMSTITAKLSEQKLDIPDLASMPEKLGNSISVLMNDYLEELRGITITKVSISSIHVDSNDMKVVQHMQKLPIYAGLFGGLKPVADSTENLSPKKIVRLSWTCSCGKENTGKFCEDCGAKGNPRWRCTCGKENTGKFCEECGFKA